jgi:hypothetical protein
MPTDEAGCPPETDVTSTPIPDDKQCLKARTLLDFMAGLGVNKEGYIPNLNQNGCPVLGEPLNTIPSNVNCGHSIAADAYVGSETNEEGCPLATDTLDAQFPNDAPCAKTVKLREYMNMHNVDGNGQQRPTPYNQPSCEELGQQTGHDATLCPHTVWILSALGDLNANDDANCPTANQPPTTPFPANATCEFTKKIWEYMRETGVNHMGQAATGPYNDDSCPTLGSADQITGTCPHTEGALTYMANAADNEAGCPDPTNYVKPIIGNCPKTKAVRRYMYLNQVNEKGQAVLPNLNVINSNTCPAVGTDYVTERYDCPYNTGANMAKDGADTNDSTCPPIADLVIPPGVSCQQTAAVLWYIQKKGITTNGIPINYNWPMYQMNETSNPEYVNVSFINMTQDKDFKLLKVPEDCTNAQNEEWLSAFTPGQGVPQHAPKGSSWKIETSDGEFVAT